MNTLFIINEEPYDNEHPYNSLRLATACRGAIPAPRHASLIKCEELLSSADFRATQGIAEERGKNAEIEEPCHKREHADHRHNQAAHAVHAQQAQDNQDDASYDTSDPTCRGSHKLYKGVHFISPI
jgi:hypothetical protein